MKKIYRLTFIFIVFFMICGFKSNTNLTIDKNKNLNVEINMSLTEHELENEDTHTKMSTNASNYEKNGFKVTTVNKDNNLGYKITKYIGNIDELSEYKNETVYISDLLESDFNNKLLFKHEKSFFKDTYTANYKYQYYEGIYLGEIEGDNFLVSQEELDNTEEETVDNNMSEIYSEKDVTEIDLVINLPVKSKDNNASKVSDDGKTLTWKINYLEANDINFSFSIYNTTSIIIVSSASVALLVALIVLLVVLQKKKGSIETLIYTDYDQSIAGQIPETMNGTVNEHPETLEILDITSSTSGVQVINTPVSNETMNNNQNTSI